MSPSNNLPPELISEILNYLPDNAELLLACSLISSAWTYPCRKILFSRVTLLLLKLIPLQKSQPTITVGENALETLFKALLRNPYLPSCIKHLRIVIGDDNDRKYWVHTAQKLKIMVSQLDSLQSAEIDVARWDHFHPDIKLALKSIISLPTLSSVALCGDGLLPDSESKSDLRTFLPMLKSVSRLRLHNFYPEHGKEELLQEVHLLPVVQHLRELWLHDSVSLSHVTSSLLPGVERTFLEKITIHRLFRPEDRKAFRALIDLSSQSLRELDLVDPHFQGYSEFAEVEDIFVHALLDKCQNLQRVYIHAEHFHDEATWPFIASLFTTTKPGSLRALEVITLYFAEHSSVPFEDRQGQGGAFWRNGKHFTGLFTEAAFPALKEFNIVVHGNIVVQGDARIDKNVKFEEFIHYFALNSTEHVAINVSFLEGYHLPCGYGMDTGMETDL